MLSTKLENDQILYRRPTQYQEFSMMLARSKKNTLDEPLTPYLKKFIRSWMKTPIGFK